MTGIEEYQYGGKPAFKGKVTCRNCGQPFELKTTDKTLFDEGKVRCFRCFMKAHDANNKLTKRSF